MAHMGLSGASSPRGSPAGAFGSEFVLEFEAVEGFDDETVGERRSLQTVTVLSSGHRTEARTEPSSCVQTPQQLRAVAREHDDITIAHRAYDDGNVIAIDFGPAVEMTVDIIGETAIVLLDDQQVEFDVPPEATDITATNGILLLEA